MAHDEEGMSPRSAIPARAGGVDGDLGGDGARAGDIGRFPARGAVERAIDYEESGRA